MLYPDISTHADVVGLDILTNPAGLAMQAVNAEGIATSLTRFVRSSAVCQVRGTMAELEIRQWQGDILLK